MDHLTPQIAKEIALFGIFAFAGLCCIIIALLDHQRKMAELIRSDRKQAGDLDSRVDSLQAEIRELKSLLAADNKQSENSALHQRVG